MKKYALLIILTLSFSISAQDAAQTAVLSLIPKPQELALEDKNPFQWTAETKIFTDTLFRQEAEYLQSLFLGKKLGPSLVEVASAGRQKGVHLKHINDLASPEAYTLKANENALIIYASNRAGMMRGIQSLRQLMGLNFAKSEDLDSWTIPALSIRDAPQFKHRGLLLDVCRHFFSVEAVKKQIDLLALYRMNVLHLHLTEDQAWRMESKKFPLLNEISSWRTEADGSRYGGFYTQEQLREIVAYAAERHITVIPEIELPGHAQAALAAYPQYSCLGETAQIEVANDWGVFKEIYCAGNDSTFWFLEEVLKEVLAIFPSSYIHIGGDEAPKYRWEHCDLCQQRIKNENLEDEHELQAYFIQRIERFLNEQGRQLIGWDEILEGGLSSTATVQSWRGMQGGRAAVEAGNRAIMSPTSHCYLDYGLHQIDLRKVYGFDPIPEGLNQEARALILGGECNMWTEHVPDERTLDQRIQPRMQALAEVLWYYPEQRDFEDFYTRLQNHYPLLETLKVNYGPETVPATIYADVYPDSNKVLIGAKRNLEDLDLEVRWQDEKGPWGFDLKESGTLSVNALKNDRPYGDTIQQEFAFHNGLASVITYKDTYSPYYPAGGDLALVNGRKGSINFRDGQWQGFAGVDVEFILDLDSIQSIDSLAANFYHYNNAWIFVPEEMRVDYSSNGKKWHRYGEVKSELALETRGNHIERLEIRNTVTARFLRLRISSIKKVPKWHEAAGSSAWVFIDELEVY